MSEEINEKVLELARKLKSLADRGVDGEKETVIAMLQRLMKKHNITMGMLNENEAKEHEFKIEITKFKFFNQIVGNVLGKVGVSSYRNQKGKKKSYFITCTPNEAVEIQARFEFFYKVWEAELEIFYSAFIQTNHLYQKPSDNQDDKEKKELTPEEKRKLFKLLNMMQSMDRHHFVKQISQ